MEVRIFDVPLLVELQRDLGVPLDAGDGIDDDSLALLHGDYAPKRVLALNSGFRPSSSSVKT